MISNIQNFFKDYDFNFVLLFGSYLTKKFHPLSDIDIGIYTRDLLSIKETGYISAKLESILYKKVDIISLYKIEQKDPNFAFNILKNHKVIHLNDRDSYIDFKKRVQLSYLDHKDLIEQNIKYLKKRVEKNSFARRDFVTQD